MFVASSPAILALPYRQVIRLCHGGVQEVPQCSGGALIDLVDAERIRCDARAWSRYLLDDKSIGERKRVRAVLNLNERIFGKCLRSHNFRRLALEHQIEPFEAVLLDERLPTKFQRHWYPQMEKQIADARAHARRNTRRR